MDRRSIRKYRFLSFHKTASCGHGHYNLGVKGENFDCLFSELSGGLVSYRYAGKNDRNDPDAQLLACTGG